MFARKTMRGIILEKGKFDTYDPPTGRIWYEADINYYEGKRNSHRIVWSNDGLAFISYDHYHTFYETI